MAFGTTPPALPAGAIQLGGGALSRRDQQLRDEQQLRDILADQQRQIQQENALRQMRLDLASGRVDTGPQGRAAIGLPGGLPSDVRRVGESGFTNIHTGPEGMQGPPQPVVPPTLPQNVKSAVDVPAQPPTPFTPENLPGGRLTTADPADFTERVPQNLTQRAVSQIPGIGPLLANPQLTRDISRGVSGQTSGLAAFGKAFAGDVASGFNQPNAINTDPTQAPAGVAEAQPQAPPQALPPQVPQGPVPQGPQGFGVPQSPQGFGQTGIDLRPPSQFGGDSMRQAMEFVNNPQNNVLFPEAVAAQQQILLKLMEMDQRERIAFEDRKQRLESSLISAAAQTGDAQLQSLTQALTSGVLTSQLAETWLRNPAITRSPGMMSLFQEYLGHLGLADGGQAPQGDVAGDFEVVSQR